MVALCDQVALCDRGRVGAAPWGPGPSSAQAGSGVASSVACRGPPLSLRAQGTPHPACSLRAMAHLVLPPGRPLRAAASLQPDARAPRGRRLRPRLAAEAVPSQRTVAGRPGQRAASFPWGPLGSQGPGVTCAWPAAGPPRAALSVQGPSKPAPEPYSKALRCAVPSSWTCPCPGRACQRRGVAGIGVDLGAIASRWVGLQVCCFLAPQNRTKCHLCGCGSQCLRVVVPSCP